MTITRYRTPPPAQEALPALPEPAYVDQHSCIELYTEEQMHAYVLADRVARPAQPSGDSGALTDDDIAKCWPGPFAFTTVPAKRAKLLAFARRVVGVQSRGPAQPKGEPVAWRCFYCDECFTDREQAADHFGVSEHDRPECQMDIRHVRWLEAEHRRSCDDDTEALRTICGLAGEHEDLRRKAEELGYARGLEDAKRHPEELGLAASPQAGAAPSPLTDEEIVDIWAGMSDNDDTINIIDLGRAIEARVLAAAPKGGAS